ncbi:MAG TPA: CCA tRNA nucleotidyltransferase, partial [Sphaerochaeta sp.]|nr:CCA tRNA nucleotidyltransferase [Sphaerochaeta sp.]
MRPFPLNETLRRFGAHFTAAGYSLYIVGGAIRDYLLGLSVQDYDFATDATPKEVMDLFRRVIPTGIEHGTVTVLFERSAFEVTTFRTDGTYLDGRRPTSVLYVTDLAQDLSRRDFTINAFAADCTSGKIIDLHAGKADLKAKQIRAIGEPTERFEEDGLRILRAARFSAKLNFSIEEKTLQAMKETKGMIDRVSAERIREELFALLASDNPHRGLTYLQKSEVLERVLPELCEGLGIEQGGMHHEDVFSHALSTAQMATHFSKDPVVRMAALLHDIG